MSTVKKSATSEKTEAEKRICRLWHLYTARIGSIDPTGHSGDLRSIDKICRDELKIANTALEIFERHACEVK